MITPAFYCIQNIHMTQTIKITIIATLIIVFGGYAHTPINAHDDEKGEADTITVDRVVELVNESRLGHGEHIVSLDKDLSYAASLKVEDMFDRQYFANNTPTGEDPWYWVLKAGYDYEYAGENLAIHFEDASKQHRAWMESPLHRKNILNGEYRDIGVSIQKGMFEGKETTIVVQLFGARMGEEALAIPSVREEYDAYKEEKLTPEETTTPYQLDEKEERGMILFTEKKSDGFLSEMLIGIVVIIALSLLLPIVLVIGMLLREWYVEHQNHSSAHTFENL